MLQRATLSREHDELDRLARDLLALIERPDPDFAELASLRWRLSRVLLVHLAKEDQLLYPRLCASPQAATGALAQRFAAEMGGLRVAFTDYVEDWPAPRAMADWAGFVAATRSVLDALRHRIQREECELYPLIA